MMNPVLNMMLMIIIGLGLYIILLSEFKYHVFLGAMLCFVFGIILVIVNDIIK